LAGPPAADAPADPPSVMDSVHETTGLHDTSRGVAARGAAGGDAGVRNSGGGFVWGPEGLTEAEAGLLGPVDGLAGQRVLEVGCGAAQCSRWLAERGVHAVGIDISVQQLRHAAPIGRMHVVAATATALPFPDSMFDVAFAAYGAIQFVGDLPRLLAEVRRVLRPGGRWVFSVTHPIRWAFPDDPGPAGLAVSGSYFDRTPYVERDDSGTAVYAEFHRTVGDYVSAVVAAGFVIEAMVEPEWPDWNESTWGGWSPLRGTHLPGTLIIGCRADARAG
ncbi:MAG TPA: class I SAM-dependent methyltransferase, partial [Candidatus Limnocylindrales bacterium]|nr:class I SAM-dependent methyltransferase [Candidatus Limnocylindrales bacterium]